MTSAVLSGPYFCALASKFLARCDDVNWCAIWHKGSERRIPAQTVRKHCFLSDHVSGKAEIYADVARHHAPFVDMRILETMSSVDQARGALMGAGLAGKPIWLALSVNDSDGTRQRSNQALADIGPLITEFAPERVLLNCSRPEADSEGLPILADLHPHVGAYANGFTRIAADFNHIGAPTDLLSKRHDLGPAAYATFAQDWVAARAKTVGGCCEVGPAYIAELAKRLRFNERYPHPVVR